VEILKFCIVLYSVTMPARNIKKSDAAGQAWLDEKD